MRAIKMGYIAFGDILCQWSERLRSDPDVVFVFIGEGVKKREICFW